MLKSAMVATLLVFSGSAFAQDAPDYSKLISALEQQRNAALTWHVQAESRAGVLADENVKLRARVKELEDKLKEKDKP